MNPLWSAMEDEYIKALENGEPVPDTIWLEPQEMLWLVALGLYLEGERIAHGSGPIETRFADRTVTIRSTTYADPCLWH